MNPAWNHRRQGDTRMFSFPTSSSASSPLRLKFHTFCEPVFLTRTGDEAYLNERTNACGLPDVLWTTFLALYLYRASRYGVSWILSYLTLLTYFYGIYYFSSLSRGFIFQRRLWLDTLHPGTARDSPTVGVSLRSLDTAFRVLLALVSVDSPS